MRTLYGKHPSVPTGNARVKSCFQGGVQGCCTYVANMSRGMKQVVRTLGRGGLFSGAVIIFASSRKVYVNTRRGTKGSVFCRRSVHVPVVLS